MQAVELSTFFSDDGNGKAVVLRVDGGYSIEYFDNGGNLFFTEDFPGKSLRYVEDAAENWAVGIKKLEDVV